MINSIKKLFARDNDRKFIKRQVLFYYNEEAYYAGMSMVRHCDNMEPIRGGKFNDGMWSIELNVYSK